MSQDDVGHDPVLFDETIAALDPKPGQTIVDCTLGRGGHSFAIAQRIGADGLLIALDVDPKNLEFAKKRLEKTPCRTRLFQANFARLEDVLDEVELPKVDSILADLGLSTNQFLDPAYGLSFSADGPLDMRIDPDISRSAADLVNTMREEDLANVLYNLADERYSRRVARKIVEARRLSPIKTTKALAELVRSAIPLKSAATGKIDPATRTFLALRIAVNQEIENLNRLLERAPLRLKPGGRVAVISFQSTEDRLVKQAFRSAEQTGLLRILSKKPLTPSDDELARNPRSRSAKLRFAEKI